ncbi:hypothetical protein QL285_070156 [Trifolium repens]|jgi:hypothetical protein|nr:hypothetical protein QL285_070156 [Trifolium repens]
MPLISSDHSPLVIRLKPKAKGGNFFKYEAFWLEHEECSTIVHQGWTSRIVSPPQDSWELFLDKCKNCKKSLSSWHSKTFKRADVEIANLKCQSSVLQDRPNHMVQWEEVMKTKKQITQLWKQEELYWSQRARVKWLNWGDRNTKCFHASTIQRRDRNKLSRIKDDNGQWVEGQTQITQVVLDHYSKVFQSESATSNYSSLTNLPGLFLKI